MGDAGFEPETSTSKSGPRPISHHISPGSNPAAPSMILSLLNLRVEKKTLHLRQHKFLESFLRSYILSPIGRSVSREVMEDFMSSLESAISQPHQDMLGVVEHLKRQGFTTGLLTNNWATGDKSLLLQVVEICLLYYIHMYVVCFNVQYFSSFFFLKENAFLYLL